MIDAAPLTPLGLLLVRPGMVVIATPAFGGMYAPPVAKIGLLVLMAILLAPTVALPAASSPGAVVVIAAGEAAVGLALAMAVRILTSAAEVAGHLVGFQLGFSYVGIVDPQTGNRNNVIATLYSSLTLLTFLSVDGHHVVLKALADSYGAIPMGVPSVDQALVGVVAEMLGIVFTVGVRLAAPVVVTLVVVELTMGLLGRAAPALNLLFFGFPIRIAIGLLVLAATLQVVPGVIQSLMVPASEISARAALAFR